MHDESKDEYYRLVDFKDLNNIPASKIFKEVCQSSQSFDYENEIYSNEFFQFSSSIFRNVIENMLNKKVICRETARIGKHVIMDIVAKCFHN